MAGLWLDLPRARQAIADNEDLGDRGAVRRIPVAGDFNGRLYAPHAHLRANRPQVAHRGCAAFGPRRVQRSPLKLAGAEGAICAATTARHARYSYRADTCQARTRTSILKSRHIRLCGERHRPHLPTAQNAHMRHSARGDRSALAWGVCGWQAAGPFRGEQRTRGATNVVGNKCSHRPKPQFPRLQRYWLGVRLSRAASLRLAADISAGRPTALC
jgi:hypothetical protein